MAVSCSVQGFAAQGNEFSYYMLITSSFMLNCSSEPEQASRLQSFATFVLPREVALLVSLLQSQVAQHMCLLSSLPMGLLEP